MTSKKYALTLSGLLFLLFAACLIFWYSALKDLYYKKDHRGELDHIGSIIITAPITPQANYNKHHTEFSDYLKSGVKKSFDVITIGDSFSTIAGGCFFQDYLVDKYGLEIVNIRFEGHEMLDTLYILDKTGWLDELKPRFVIIESVERYVNDRFGLKNISPENIKALDKETITELSRVSDKQGDFIKIIPSVIFRASMKFLYDHVYRIMPGNNGRLSEKVYTAKLNQPMFTNPSMENILLYYYEDLDYLKTPFNTAMVNKNFNDAAEYFGKRGIKIIFMPCADKYDLYYPYIENNNNPPANPFFDEIEKLDKKYYLINTRNISRKLLSDGERDVYWLDETHWSWKAQQSVGDKLAEIILSER